MKILLTGSAGNIGNRLVKAKNLFCSDSTKSNHINLLDFSIPYCKLNFPLLFKSH